MLSVIIVNWNTRDLLDACLRSIRQYPPRTNYEVIVVDNASHDGSADMVRERHPWVYLLAETRNHGYAAGNNLGFAVARGDTLLTLNPDTEFEDDSLNLALDIFMRETDYSAMGIRQVGIDGETQRSVRGFPNLLAIAAAVLSLDRWIPSLDTYLLRRFDYTQSQSCPQPMATFTLFRRSALAEIGDPRAPFDADFPIFFNDADLLYRLDQAGHRCWYAAEPWVRHHGGAGTRQVRRSMIWESHHSLIRFWRKHPGTCPHPLALYGAIPAVWFAALIRARGYHAGFRV
ncbi:MAG: glycosyltransferase family 2 protein [Fimbriimonadaceae bacterium]|nr:glycosyltransferase family 2 protein [Fimbriimonadaceae bacterium]